MSAGPLIGRRKFLVLSSTCAVGAIAVGPKLFAAPPAAQARLALGFAPFDSVAGLVAASTIPAGDGAFIARGARVTVGGSSGAPAGGSRAVELVANYSYMNGARREIAPFRAWACDPRTGCGGNRVNFNVPVDEVQVLSFQIAVTPSANASSNAGSKKVGGSDGLSLPVELTLLSGEGVKLTRGYYVLVPLLDKATEPAWSAYSVAEVDGRWVLADAAGNVAPFEHFVIRIDYAS